MYCPKCGEKTTVSWTNPETGRVLRNRICPSCCYQFSTVEVERSEEGMGNKTWKNNDKCPFNDNVECSMEGRKCSKCGWNPIVNEERKKDGNS